MANGNFFGRSVSIAGLGSRGDFLCWAEVGFLLGKFYDPSDIQEFCDYLGPLVNRTNLCCDCTAVVSDCDKAGTLEAALDVKKIDLGILPASWPQLVAAFLASDVPFPLVLEVENLGAVVRHVQIVTGLAEGSGEEGLVTLDPLGKDYRRFYTIDHLQELVTNGHFSIKSTRPTQDRRSSHEVANGHWLADTPLRPAFLPNVVAAQGVTGAEEAIGRLLNLADAAHLAAYPLQVGYFQKAAPESSVAEMTGWRFVLQDGSGEFILVDMFDSAGTGPWRVGRVSFGEMTTRRIQGLDSYLRSKDEGTWTLRFQDWTDLGLDVALLGAPAVGSSSIPAKDEIRLIGPRTYLGLGEGSLIPRLAGPYLSQLEQALESARQ